MATSTPVQVRFADEELDALDSYRREKRNPPSRPQAIRELTRASLTRGEMTKLDTNSNVTIGRVPAASAR